MKTPQPMNGLEDSLKGNVVDKNIKTNGLLKFLFNF